MARLRRGRQNCPDPDPGPIGGTPSTRFSARTAFGALTSLPRNDSHKVYYGISPGISNFSCFAVGIGPDLTRLGSHLYPAIRLQGRRTRALRAAASEPAMP